MRKLMKAISLAVLGAICLCGCALGNSGKKEITIYTAVDQIYAEPVFEDFEKETGIKVNAVYDLEANKTTGLTNRLIAEKDKPVCDVYWNNEFTQTMLLQDEGLYSLMYLLKQPIFRMLTKMQKVIGPHLAEEPA